MCRVVIVIFDRSYLCEVSETTKQGQCKTINDEDPSVFESCCRQRKGFWICSTSLEYLYAVVQYTFFLSCHRQLELLVKFVQITKGIGVRKAGYKRDWIDEHRFQERIRLWFSFNCQIFLGFWIYFYIAYFLTPFKTFMQTVLRSLF